MGTKSAAANRFWAPRWSWHFLAWSFPSHSVALHTKGSYASITHRFDELLVCSEHNAIYRFVNKGRLLLESVIFSYQRATKFVS
jgi:hypothetical protein